MASHQLTFPQLYGEWESALQLSEEAKLEMMQEKVIRPANHAADRITGTNYVASLAFIEHAEAKKLDGKPKPSLDIQGCFRCNSSAHLAKDCSRSLNLARSAFRKLKYFNKKKASSPVHIVLPDICHQFDEGGESEHEDDSPIFVLLLNGFKPTATGATGDDQLSQKEDALVLETTSHVLTSDQEKFHGACIDSGAQITVVSYRQAETDCRQHGGSLSPTFSRGTYRFGNKRPRGTGWTRIRVPVSAPHILDVKADVVDVDIPFLLGLDVISDLKALLDVGNDKIVSPPSG